MLHTGRTTEYRGRGQRRVAAVLLAALALLSASACSLPGGATNTTVAADEYGVLTETIVETLDADSANFTEEELTAYIEEEIAVFNTAHGEDAVTLESCRLQGNSVRIQQSYQSWEFYSAFNQVNCFQGTLREAEEKGYDMSIPFYDSRGQEANAETLQDRGGEWKVLIVEEPILVKTPDKILYASDNVTITGRLSATVNTVLSEEHQEEAYSAYAHVSDRNAYIIYK